MVACCAVMGPAASTHNVSLVCSIALSCPCCCFEKASECMVFAPDLCAMQLPHADVL